MQPPEFMAAFQRKAIDGFSNSPPFIQQVVLDGTGVIVSDSTQGRADRILAGVVVAAPGARGLLPGHGSICAKMVQGVVEALRLIRTDRATALAVMKAHFGTYDDQVLGAAYDMLKAMTPDPPLTTRAGARERRQHEHRRRLHEAGGKAAALRHADRQ